MTNLKTVLTACRSFLDVHPTETIILSSQCEANCKAQYNSLFYKAIVSAFPTSELRSARLYGYNEDWKHSRGFEQSREIPALKDVRGKIVFFNLNHDNFPGLQRWRIPTKTHENCYQTDCAWIGSCRFIWNMGRHKCKYGGIKESYYERIDKNILNAASKPRTRLFYKTQVSSAGLKFPGCFGSIRRLAR